MCTVEFMPLFRRAKGRASPDSTALKPTEGADVARATITDIDWADPEAVVAEWRNDSEAPNWGRAMEMFDEGPVQGQRLNVAEYMTRRLKLVLLGGSDMPDDLAAEVCRRILVLLSQPVLDWQEEFVPRLVRLPLAIMRSRGWQPEEYGGDGTVQVDLRAAPIRASVATTRAPDGDYVAYFFSRS